MTNKIFMNRKTAEQVELISNSNGRFIILLADGAQKSYSESTFKKMFKAVEEPKAHEEPKEEPEVEAKSESKRPATEKAEEKATEQKASKTKKAEVKHEELTEEKKEKMIEKIQKLLSLAGNNPSEAEAAAALRKAQELMAKYSLSVSEASGKTYKYTSLPCHHYHNVAVRFPLANIISKSFRCKAILVGEIIHMFGREEDAKAAVECFNFCYAWMQRVGNKLIAEAREKTGTAKGVFNSYAAGVLKGLTTSLEEGCTTLAIVVPEDVTKNFEETYKNLGSCKRSMQFGEFNGAAYTKGLKDGKVMMGHRTIEVNL